MDFSDAVSMAEALYPLPRPYYGVGGMVQQYTESQLAALVERIRVGEEIEYHIVNGSVLRTEYAAPDPLPHLLKRITEDGHVVSMDDTIYGEVIETSTRPPLRKAGLVMRYTPAQRAALEARINAGEEVGYHLIDGDVFPTHDSDIDHSSYPVPMHITEDGHVVPLPGYDLPPRVALDPSPRAATAGLIHDGLVPHYTESQLAALEERIRRGDEQDYYVDDGKVYRVPSARPGLFGGSEQRLMRITEDGNVVYAGVVYVNESNAGPGVGEPPPRVRTAGVVSQYTPAQRAAFEERIRNRKEHEYHMVDGDVYPIPNTRYSARHTTPHQRMRLTDRGRVAPEYTAQEREDLVAEDGDFSGPMMDPFPSTSDRAGPTAAPTQSSARVGIEMIASYVLPLDAHHYPGPGYDEKDLRAAQRIASYDYETYDNEEYLAHMSADLLKQKVNREHHEPWGTMPPSMISCKTSSKISALLKELDRLVALHNYAEHMVKHDAALVRRVVVDRQG